LSRCAARWADVKVLIFAHTPPPHHGQSFMVKLLLDGFGGDARQRHNTAPNDRQNLSRPPADHVIECYHIDARFSSDIQDLGTIRPRKIALVFRYAFAAIWCRFRYGADSFYFAPAPAKKGAFYRDLLVMLLCRPFFRRFIHHWHAVGLSDWLQNERSPLERWLAQQLLGRPTLGLAVATANLRDPLWFRSREVLVVPNGIPDPFPDYEVTLQPIRRRRRELRRRLIDGESLPNESDPDGTCQFRVLYLAHCFREKGIFETLEGVAETRRTLDAAKSPLRVHLTVAGDFASSEDRDAFMNRIRAPDLAGSVEYIGFVAGPEKERLLRESDCLCFPTYSDSFGLVVLEAMAAGLAVVATVWRALPEVLPPDYPGFVPIRDAAAIARVLPELFLYDTEQLRSHFLEYFTIHAHLRRMREAFRW
jgi:glycosyltransferase involved in cell wall biosynthesis